MVTQYPHTIILTVHFEPEQDLDTGLFSAGGEDVCYTFKCRAEVNSAGAKVFGFDGAIEDYSHLVYLPRHSYILPNGTTYTLTRGSDVITGKIKGSSNDQLSSRVWL